MAALINRAWRLFGTGLSFAVFGIGALFLVVLVFPLISLLSKDRGSRGLRARSVVNHSFRGFLWMMHSLGVFDFDVDPRCREACSAEHGLIVVANHPTLIDVVQLLAEVKHGNCIVKRAMWNNPFLGGVVRATNYISNDDSEELLSRCVEVLKHGETLVIFPEATRTVPGQPMQLRRGAARVALASGAPIQMVHIRCDPSTLSKAEHWYAIPRRRPCLKMSVGDRLNIGVFKRDGEEPSLASRRLTDLMNDKFTSFDHYK
ncbi:MAG: lysophospholipid acyltransferase family protein [Woeseiaceae bacterium]|nr:lysophospholipid acyltransferase family protein [Woeseiaceae bacterium]